MAIHATLLQPVLTVPEVTHANVILDTPATASFAMVSRNGRYCRNNDSCQTGGDRENCEPFGEAISD